MSGISGIISSTSRPLDQQEKEMHLEGVRRRGPDGIEIFSGEGVFLAHGHLGLPSHVGSNLQADNDGPKIIGDLRLDDRQTLIKALDMADIPLDVSDVDLLRHAYAKWGTDLCTHIIGDFAFALWDADKKLLFCARDHMGVRPFYYRLDEDRICFSSDLKALGADFYQTFSDDQIAAFLAGLNDASEETQHPGIKRLLPAHALVWQGGHLSTHCYWKLEPKEYQGTDAAADFRSLFECAIKDRLREGDAVGAMLSGGLDSSAVSCVASRILQGSEGKPLKVYSLVFENTPDLDESGYVDAVLETGQFDAYRKACDNTPAFGIIDQTFSVQQGFPHGPNSAIGHQIYEVATHHGTHILLDGHGGDEVVWQGGFRIAELAAQGKWLEAIGLIDTICQIYDESRVLAFLGVVSEFGKPRLTRKLASALRKRWKRWSEGAKARPMWQQCFNRDFVQRSGIQARQKAHFDQRQGAPKVTDQDHQFDALTAPIITLAFEELDRASAARGVESRYPFYDIRLVEFCLSLPASEKMRKNETRSIMKRALKGILPEMVRTRQTKINFISAITDGILNHHVDWLDEIQSGRAGSLYDYIDKERMSLMIDRLKQQRSDMNGHDITFIWRTLTLYAWLKNKSDHVSHAQG